MLPTAPAGGNAGALARPGLATGVRLRRVPSIAIDPTRRWLLMSDDGRLDVIVLDLVTNETMAFAYGRRDAARCS